MYTCQNLTIPEEILSNAQHLKSVCNWKIWSEEIDYKSKKCLLDLLPAFTSNIDVEREKTLRMLFDGQVFMLENPLEQFNKLLKEGSFKPQIWQYHKAHRRNLYKEFHHQLHSYHCNLLREIILLRKQTLQQAHRLNSYIPAPHPQDIDSALKVSRYNYRPQLCPLMSQVLKRHKKSKNFLPLKMGMKEGIKTSWQTHWNELKTRMGDAFSSNNGDTTEETNSDSNTYNDDLTRPPGSKQGDQKSKRFQKRQRASIPCLANDSSEDEIPYATSLATRRRGTDLQRHGYSFSGSLKSKSGCESDYEQFLKGPYKGLIKDKIYKNI